MKIHGFLCRRVLREVSRAEVAVDLLYFGNEMNPFDPAVILVCFKHP